MSKYHLRRGGKLGNWTFRVGNWKLIFLNNQYPMSNNQCPSIACEEVENLKIGNSVLEIGNLDF